MARLRRASNGVSGGAVLAGLLGVGAVAWIVGSSKKANAAPPVAQPPATTPPVTSVPGTPNASDGGLASLPEPYRSIANATLGNPAKTVTDLEELAKVLDGIGQTVAASQVRAQNPGAHEGTSPSGFASNPDYQWPYIVKQNDSPSLIAAKIVGDDRRYPELIAANPQKPNNGRAFPALNFLTLNPNERILIPKAWNDYITQDGTAAGSPVRFTRNPAGYTPGDP